MKFTTLTTAAAVTAFATTASALSVDVTSVTGVWVDVDPTSGITGENTNQISWGTPAGGQPNQSSYVFDGVAPPQVNDVLNPFTIGTFTHNNYPINGTTLNEATLDVTLLGFVDENDNNIFDGVDLAFSLSRKFTFTHDETGNGGSCPYGGANNQGVNINGCADRVSLSAETPTIEDVLIIDGIAYSFKIDGFDLGGDPSEFFLTTENAANTADLKASFVSAAIPLPAGAFLLLGGLGVMAASRRRRKAS